MMSVTLGNAYFYKKNSNYVEFNNKIINTHMLTRVFEFILNRQTFFLLKQKLVVSC